eukprot:TRINITY_DN20599_c0_g1_i2.p1 TRINITY_DN20599_c0_g1~~TRINITY_DN20599_c0_g1_i2.p1  ORF type:complete len:803 (-),score=88.60 TRINITY_DN20599_c0_g1_i2:154-2562(-)
MRISSLNASFAGGAAFKDPIAADRANAQVHVSSRLSSGTLFAEQRRRSLGTSRAESSHSPFRRLSTAVGADVSDLGDGPGATSAKHSFQALGGIRGTRTARDHFDGRSSPAPVNALERNGLGLGASSRCGSGDYRRGRESCYGTLSDSSALFANGSQATRGANDFRRSDDHVGISRADSRGAASRTGSRGTSCGGSRRESSCGSCFGDLDRSMSRRSSPERLSRLQTSQTSATSSRCRPSQVTATAPVPTPFMPLPASTALESPALREQRLRAERAEAELAKVTRALEEAQQRHRDANQLLKRLADANAALRSQLRGQENCDQNIDKIHTFGPDCDRGDTHVLMGDKEVSFSSTTDPLSGGISHRASAHSSSRTSSSPTPALARGLAEAMSAGGEGQALRDRVWALERDLQESRRALAESRAELELARSKRQEADRRITELAARSDENSRVGKAEVAELRQEVAARERCLRSSEAQLERARNVEAHAQRLATKASCIADAEARAEAARADNGARAMRHSLELELSNARKETLLARHRAEAAEARQECSEASNAQAELRADRWRGECEELRSELEDARLEFAECRMRSAVVSTHEAAAAKRCANLSDDLAATRHETAWEYRCFRRAEERLQNIESETASTMAPRMNARDAMPQPSPRTEENEETMRRVFAEVDALDRGLRAECQRLQDEVAERIADSDRVGARVSEFVQSDGEFSGRVRVVELEEEVAVLRQELREYQASSGQAVDVARCAGYPQLWAPRRSAATVMEESKAVSSEDLHSQRCSGSLSSSLSSTAASVFFHPP